MVTPYHVPVRRGKFPVHVFSNTACPNSNKSDRDITSNGTLAMPETSLRVHEGQCGGTLYLTIVGSAADCCDLSFEALQLQAHGQLGLFSFWATILPR